MLSLRVVSTVLVVVGALAAPAYADQIEVPGDFAVLQDAVDAASAGDVIVIAPGIYDGIVIDTSLSLVGRGGTPFIRVGPGGGAIEQDPAVTLAGPGGGTVTLSNVDLGGTTNGVIFGVAGPAIQGGGFDALRILHCDVAAPTWESVTGLASAAAAIQVSVPWILVQGSVVTGGMGDDDNSGAFNFDVPSGAPAILASSSTVTVLDSVVRGGDGRDTTFAFDFPFGCPSTCNDISGGAGGAAISASGVEHAGSIITGGDGGFMQCNDGVTTTTICAKPSGAAIVNASQVVPLPGTLLGNGPLTLGSDWSLTWSSSEPSILLLLSAVPTPSIAVGNKGLLFMAPGTFVQIPAPGGLQSLSLPISTDPVLQGFPLVFQIFDTANGISRPVFASFVDA